MAGTESREKFRCTTSVHLEVLLFPFKEPKEEDEKNFKRLKNYPGRCVVAIIEKFLIIGCKPE